MHDVIIIGGGLAGLTAGLRLSKNGKKVLVFERHSIPGGYATNFRRKDSEGNIYTFDVSLHSLSGAKEGATVYNIFKSLDLLDDIEIINKDHDTILNYRGETLRITNDPEKYKNLLKEKFDPDGIESLFKYLRDFYDNLIGLSLETEIPKYEDELSGVTLEKLLRKFVDDDKFIEVFSYL